MPLVVGDAELAMRICEAALTRGVFAQAIRPPTVPPMTSRLRLAVMASHREEELRAAARTLGQAARAAGFEPRHVRPASAAAAARAGEPSRARPCRRPIDATPEDAPPPPRAGVFDFEAPEEPGRVAGGVRGLFVTGTDTGVGKTVLAAAIVAALRAPRDRRSERSSR